MQVTVSHPVTGAARSVDESEVERYQGLGWSVQLPNPRRGAPPDEPDVEAGKAQLLAATGEVPGELHLGSKARAKAARAEAAEAEPQEAEDATGEDTPPVDPEAETGYAGLQVDKGASDDG